MYTSIFWLQFDTPALSDSEHRMYISSTMWPIGRIATYALVLKEKRSGSLTKVTVTPAPKLLHHSALCNSCPLVGNLLPFFLIFHSNYLNDNYSMLATHAWEPVLEEMCTMCFSSQDRYTSIKLQTENKHTHIPSNILLSACKCHPLIYCTWALKTTFYILLTIRWYLL